MRLADKVATMARRGAPLPYLRRVAYLYSPSDQQYIKFRKNVVFPAAICLKYERLNWGQNYNIVFGTKSDSGNLWFTFGWRNGSGLNDRFMVERQRKVFSTTEIGGAPELPFTFLAELKTDDKLYLNGQVVSSGGWYRQDRLDVGSHDIYLGVGGARVYEASYYCDDWGFHAIPVLDLSGRPAIYDEVSGQLLYNQGTGEFTWGELDASSALSASRGGVLNA